MNYLNININKKHMINYNKRKEEFLKSFEIMNSGFICIGVKMIPIILEDDPVVINRASKFIGDS